MHCMYHIQLQYFILCCSLSSAPYMRVPQHEREGWVLTSTDLKNNDEEANGATNLVREESFMKCLDLGAK